MNNDGTKFLVNVNRFLKRIDKDISQVTYLDYFIFHYINFIAVEKLKPIIPRYYMDKERDMYIDIKLDQHGLQALALALGNALRSFLLDRCLTVCSLRCPLNLDKKINLKDQIKQADNKKEKEILEDLLDIFKDDPITSEMALSRELYDLVMEVLTDTQDSEIGELVEDDGDLQVVRLSRSGMTVYVLTDLLEDYTMEFFELFDKKYLEQHNHSALQEFESLSLENNF